MPSLRVVLDIDDHGDKGMRKVDHSKVIHLPDPKMEIVRVPRGMASGKSSVMIRIDLPDGRTVIAETSMALFQMAAQAFAAKEGQ